MKKIIAAFLALSLLICVCATASAEEVSSSRDTASAEAEIMPIQDSYDVTVTWKGMIFTYCEEHNGEWKPDTLDYNEGSVPAHWESSDETVQNKYGTITIESKTDISFTISFVQNTELNSDTAANKATAAIRYLESPPTDDDWSKSRPIYGQDERYKLKGSVLSNNSYSIYVLPGLAGATDYSIINNLSDGILGTLSIQIERNDNPFSDPSAPEGPGTGEELIFE